MTGRDIDAARRRLNKVRDRADLTAKHLGGQIRFTEFVGAPAYTETHVGTLLGFRHRIGYGLFGFRLFTDVTVCVDCDGTVCESGTEFTEIADEVRMWRGGDEPPAEDDGDDQ